MNREAALRRRQNSSSEPTSAAASPVPSQTPSTAVALSSEGGLLVDEERRRVLQHDVAANTVVKVQATAGCGKTRLLQAYAQARPRSSFLYVAFNKDLQEIKHAEFAAAGATNITVKTAHSVAFGAMAHELRLSSRLTPIDRNTRKTLQQLGNDEVSYPQATAVKETLQAFTRSIDLLLCLAHVPYDAKHRDRVLGYAEQIWEDVASGGSSGVEHDEYMKLFQLLTPAMRFRKALQKYDVILLDEAHDLTPCQCDAFTAHDQYRVIAMFDPHQCINQFRGADGVAFLSAMPGLSFTLAKTFRFGNPLAAFVRNFIVAAKPHHSAFEIEPANVTTTIEAMADVTDAVARVGGGGLVVLARTNVQLLQTAHALLHRGVRQIGWLGKFGSEFGSGGLKEWRQLCKFSKGSCGYQGWQAGKYNSYKRAHLGSGDGLTKSYITDPATTSRLLFLEAVGPAGLELMLIEIENALGETIREQPQLFKGRLEQKVSTKPTILFSTVHKAKGLGWANIYVDEDVLQYEDEDQEGCLDSRWGANGEDSKMEFKGEELNITYVALTRATQQLMLHHTVADRIRKAFGVSLP